MLRATRKPWNASRASETGDASEKQPTTERRPKSFWRNSDSTTADRPGGIPTRDPTTPNRQKPARETGGKRPGAAAKVCALQASESWHKAGNGPKKRSSKRAKPPSTGPKDTVPQLNLSRKVPKPKDPELLELERRVDMLRTTVTKADLREEWDNLHQRHRKFEEVGNEFLSLLQRKMHHPQEAENLQWLAAKAIRYFFCVSEEFYITLAYSHIPLALFAAGESVRSLHFFALKAAVSRRLFIEAVNIAFGYKSAAAKGGKPVTGDNSSAECWMKVGGPELLIKQLLDCLKIQENSTLVWYDSHVADTVSPPASLKTVAYVVRPDTEKQPIVAVPLRMNSNAHEKDEMRFHLRQICMDKEHILDCRSLEFQSYVILIRKRYKELVGPIESYLPLPFGIGNSTLYVCDTRHTPVPCPDDTNGTLDQARWFAGYEDPCGLLVAQLWATAVSPDMWSVIQFSEHWNRATQARAGMPLGHQTPFVEALTEPSVDLGEKARSQYLNYINNNFGRTRCVSMSGIVRRANIFGVRLDKEPWHVVQFCCRCYGGIVYTRSSAQGKTETELQQERDDAYLLQSGSLAILEGLAAEAVVKRPSNEKQLLGCLINYIKKNETMLRTVVTNAMHTEDTAPKIMLPPRSTCYRGMTPLQLVHCVGAKAVPYQHIDSRNPLEDFFSSAAAHAQRREQAFSPTDAEPRSIGDSSDGAEITKMRNPESCGAFKFSSPVGMLTEYFGTANSYGMSTPLSEDSGKEGMFVMMPVATKAQTVASTPLSPSPPSSRRGSQGRFARTKLSHRGTNTAFVRSMKATGGTGNNFSSSFGAATTTTSSLETETPNAQQQQRREKGATSPPARLMTGDHEASLQGLANHFDSISGSNDLAYPPTLRNNLTMQYSPVESGHSRSGDGEIDVDITNSTTSNATEPDTRSLQMGEGDQHAGTSINEPNRSWSLWSDWESSRSSTPPSPMCPLSPALPADGDNALGDAQFSLFDIPPFDPSEAEPS